MKLEQNEFEQAEAYFLQALSVSRSVKDQRSSASCLNYLGLINQFNNLPVAAADWYAQALVMRQDIDYPDQEAQASSNIGGTQYQMGRIKKH